MKLRLGWGLRRIDVNFLNNYKWRFTILMARNTRINFGISMEWVGYAGATGNACLLVSLRFVVIWCCGLKLGWRYTKLVLSTYSITRFLDVDTKFSYKGIHLVSDKAILVKCDVRNC